MIDFDKGLISIDYFVEKQKDGIMFARLNDSKYNGDNQYYNNGGYINYSNKVGKMVFKHEYYPNVKKDKLQSFANATFCELQYVFNYLKHGDLITILDFNGLIDSRIKKDFTNKGCFKIDNFKVFTNKSLREKSTYKWLSEYFKNHNLLSDSLCDINYYKDKILQILDNKQDFEEIERYFSVK